MARRSRQPAQKEKVAEVRGSPPMTSGDPELVMCRADLRSAGHRAWSR